MRFIFAVSFFKKILVPGLTSAALIAQGLLFPFHFIHNITYGVKGTHVLARPTTIVDAQTPIILTSINSPLEQQPFTHTFGNPAGCSNVAPTSLSSSDMLANVQAQLGSSITLAGKRQNYIWNGPLNTMMNVTDDPFVFEFVFNEFQPPFTYKADQLATIFLNNGFVIWFRSYGDQFRLLTIPLKEGVYQSAWGEYVRAYWQNGGIPADDKIQPVTKKLPCQWVVDQGFVTDQQLRETFNFDWRIPDYLTEGRKFLASNCKDANRISQDEIGYWDARSMCGPLAWRIVKDANSFPYRIGNWYSSATLFTQANPRWNGKPWLGFDPETYDLISTDKPMMGYDFADHGNLYPGDIVYSFSTLYAKNDGRFDHIFLVAGVDANNSRISISNMVQNAPYADCSIREITLYTPGNQQTGVINYEWNNHGYGSTGSTGFDVLRWKWITYHINGQPIQYTVRWGDTLETIAFDWKVSPQSILDVNQLRPNAQFTPGQIIILPATTASLGL